MTDSVVTSSTTLVAIRRTELPNLDEKNPFTEDSYHHSEYYSNQQLLGFFN
jgi:hypothetical protein